MKDNVFEFDHSLPDELKEELSNVDVRERITDLLKIAGRALSVNEVLIGLYNTHGKIYKRQYIYKVLSELQRSKLIAKEGRGLYVSAEPGE